MAIEKTLNELLEWTWINRIEIINAGFQGNPGQKGCLHRKFKGNAGVDMIYRHYAALDRLESQKLKPRVINYFFDALIGSVSSATSEFAKHNPPLRQPRICCRIIDKDTRPKNNEWSNLTDLKERGENQTKGRFIFFIKNYEPVRERVYLNLEEISRGTSFGTIMEKVWHLDGLSQMKVVVPGSNRLDSAVIYCRDVKTRDSVIKIIKKNRRKMGWYFNGQLPSMVKSTGVPGIGHGAEPPHTRPIGNSTDHLVAIKAKQSFGLYRSYLIFLALEQTQFPEEADNKRHSVVFYKSAPKQLSDFKRNVVKIFKKAGLSASRPHKQGHATFEPYEEVVMPPPPPPATKPVLTERPLPPLPTR